MDNKALKVGVVSGVVSSLIMLLFIQPILRSVWHAVIWVGGHLHKGYVDGIYRTAAIGDSDVMGIYAVVMMLMFVGAGILLLLRLYGPFSRRGTNSEGCSLLVEVAFIVVLVLGIFSFAATFVASSIMAGTEEMRSSFTQRLAVLAPAISDAEYKTFKARFASMNGKADYDAVVAAMDKRAGELGITLPRVQNP